MVPRSGPIRRRDRPILFYFLIKFVHVIGAAVLLGTGSGIAFFMLVAHLSRDAAFVARTAGVVVLADTLFTASAVVLQPITGGLLLYQTGIPASEGWVAVSIGLYLATGAVWLPVVWMQIRMRDLARTAASADETLPAAYHRLFRWWFACGIPGFGFVLAIVWLMIVKPSV